MLTAVCLLGYFAIISLSSSSTAAIMGIFATFFGGLGVGSLWKPDTVGVIASQILKNLTKEGSSDSSDSHDRQVQKRTSGSVQVMAHDQSNVSITVHSGKKKNVQNLQEEKENLSEKEETLRKETIVVAPSESYYYEFDLIRGDKIRGEVTSTNPIDIFFLDEVNFDKWDRGRKYFEPESTNDSVLETDIDYLVPRKGKWYVIIENNSRKSATVKISLRT